MKFKIGDLIRYGLTDSFGCLGILLRKLQWDESENGDYLNWDGQAAWWIQFVGDDKPLWYYEVELTLVSKGN